MISLLDQFKITDPNSFRNTLRGPNQLARTFRLLLEGPLDIYVGGKKVQPFDPLHWADPQTTHYTDGWEKVNYTSRTGEQDTFSIRAAQYRPGHSMKGQNVGQGISWIRNLREVDYGICKDLFAFSGPMAGFWCEIKFSGALLDEHMNLTTRKDGVDPDQSMLNKLSSVLAPYVAAAKQDSRTKQKDNSLITNDVAQSLQDYCADVKKIENLLDLPPIETVERSFTPGKDSKPSKSGKVDKKNLSVVPKVSTGGEISFEVQGKRKFEFEMVAGRASGFLYEAELEQNIIRIFANEDHDFLAKNLVCSTEAKVSEVIKHILAALAFADLQVCDKYRDAFEDWKTTFNNNLRNLSKSL